MRASLLTAGLMVGFVICWSSGFIASHWATQAKIPALDLFAWRFLIATLLAALWWRWRWVRRSRRKATLRGWLIETLVGSLTMGGYLLGILLAIQSGVSAGVASLITAQQPVLVAVLAVLWLHERVSPLAWLGMLIATGGVMLCIVGDLQGVGNANVWRYGLPLLSVICVTVGSVIAARHPSGLDLSATLTAQLGAACVIFTLAALIAGGGHLQFPGRAPTTWVAIGWLILLSSFGGYGFFILCLRRVGVTAVTTAIYLTPPVTLLWAALAFGESIGGFAALGMGIATLGVAITLWTRRTTASRTLTPLTQNSR